MWMRWGPVLGLVLWIQTHARDGGAPNILDLTVSNHRLVYGGNIEIACTTIVIPGQTLQIVKTGHEVAALGGQSGLPLVLTFNSKIRNSLNGKGHRYSANATEIDETTSIRTFMLFIKNVHPLDSGTYSCRIVDIEDTIIKVSNEEDVVIEGPPIKLGCDERQVDADVGDKLVTMACHIVADPLPTITWSVGINPLHLEWRVESPYRDDNVTVITEVTGRKISSHVTWNTLYVTGRYTMLAKNEYGTSWSYVDINSRGSTSRPLHYPRFHVSQSQAPEGSTIMLSCFTMYMNTGMDVTQIIKMAAAPLSREDAPVDERSEWLVLSNDTWIADLSPHIRSRYTILSSIVEDIYTNTTLIIEDALPRDSGTYSCGTLEGDIMTSEVITSPKTVIVEGRMLYIKIALVDEEEGGHRAQPHSSHSSYHLVFQVGQESYFICEFRYTHAMGLREEPTVTATAGEQNLTAEMKLEDSVTSTTVFDKNIKEQASVYRYRGTMLPTARHHNNNLSCIINLPGIHGEPVSHSVVIKVNGTDASSAPHAFSSHLCLKTSLSSWIIILTLNSYLHLS